MKRSDIPEVRAGTWVQFSRVVRVDDNPPHVVPVFDLDGPGGIAVTPQVLRQSGFTVRTFDYEPGPTELVMPKDVVARAVTAELDAASARAELTIAQQACESAERKLARSERQRRDNLKFDRFLADVERARVRLLTALLEYTHNWMDEFHQPPPEPLHKLYASAVRRPCPTYLGDAEPVEHDDGPAGEGAPCVRAYDHEGLHSTVEGVRFDAPRLFTYQPLPGDPQ